MSKLDHFNLVAPYYERVFGQHPLEKLISLASLPVRGYILDVGGGTGRISHALAGFGSGIIVIDPSMGMLKQAMKKDRLNLINSISEALPLASGSIDCIIMIDALHHVFSHEKTTHELWRVLKPGGKILIEEPDIRRFSVKLIALAEKAIFMRSHFLAPLQIASYFHYENANVQIEEEGYSTWVMINKMGERV